MTCLSCLLLLRLWWSRSFPEGRLRTGPALVLWCDFFGHELLVGAVVRCLKRMENP